MLIHKIFRTVRQRLDFLWHNTDVSLVERLRLVSHLHIYQQHRVHRLILQKMAVDAEGERYFRIGNTAIYFTPDYPINNDDFFLFGITQVIAETFWLPRFFSPHVQIRPGDIVLDVGANIGTTAILFSKMVGEQGQVIAIEPVTHAVIRKNLARNSVGNVRVEPVAVGETEGQAAIYVSDFCLDSSLVYDLDKKHYYSNEQTVEVRSIDRIAADIGLERVDFIKVDIEGAEEAALRGAQRLIQSCRPKWSISSYHLDHVHEPQHPKLVSLLKSYGYTVHTEDTSHIFAWHEEGHIMPNKDYAHRH